MIATADVSTERRVERRPSRPEGLSGQSQRRVSRRSLLIVEDDHAIREALADILGMEGYEVALAENGLDALTYLRRGGRPDAILLDLMMPVMDGWEFRVQQKNDPALSAIPVIALSADGTPKAAAIDAAVYLKKPIAHETLVNAVERVMLDVERRELAMRLTEVDRLKSLGTLAAGVAHEINNPLTYVLMNLALVSREVATLPIEPVPHTALVNAVEHASHGALRIRDIVRGLRTFSRQPDDSRPRVELEAIDVRAALESAISMVHHELSPRARLVREYAPVPVVRAQEARIGQVFVNLLLNAIQSLPEANPEDQEIRVRLRQEGRMVVIEVEDTGAGIPEEIRGRIFEPFFTTKSVGEGIGLGLSICHGIVRSLGGELTFESAPGRGTTFRVSLVAADSA